jgi:hypothetical protein
MSTESISHIDEAAILLRIFNTAFSDLAPEAARAILKIRLEEKDRERVNELVVKAQDGNLTSLEEFELESFRRVSRIVEMMWSKARISLKKAGQMVEEDRNG